MFCVLCIFCLNNTLWKIINTVCNRFLVVRWNSTFLKKISEWLICSCVSMYFHRLQTDYARIDEHIFYNLNRCRYCITVYWIKQNFNFFSQCSLIFCVSRLIFFLIQFIWLKFVLRFLMFNNVFHLSFFFHTSTYSIGVFSDCFNSKWVNGHNI